MKNKIILLLTIFICFLLQCTVLQKIAIGGIAPNLLLILPVAFGLMRGKTTGLVTGFIIGLLADLMYADLPGIYALLYMWMGYLAGFTYQIFYDDNIRIPLLLVAGEDLLYNFCVYVIFFLLQGKLDFFFYLRRIIIPEMFYTLILTAIIYKLLYLINYRLMNQVQNERTSSWLLK